MNSNCQTFSHKNVELLTEMESLVQDSMMGRTMLLNSISRGSLMPSCCNNTCSWSISCFNCCMTPCFVSGCCFWSHGGVGLAEEVVELGGIAGEKREDPDETNNQTVDKC